MIHFWRTIISLPSMTTLFVLYTAPPGVPLDFTMDVLGPRNITFSWVTGSPDADHLDSGPDQGRRENLHNAPNGYIISCTPQPIEFPYSSVAPNTTSSTTHSRHTLGGFRPGTDYSCNLRAYNSAGMGQEVTATATTPGMYNCTSYFTML